MKTPLLNCFDSSNVFEIGVDESGRGPLFGRVYAAAVILPKDFDHSKMRDSKTIKSRKVMKELSDYIKEKAIAYHISYIESDVIDKMNILQANMKAMHECIREILKCIQETDVLKILIIIDGNYFKPYTVFDENTGELICYRVEMVVKGDSIYSSIAAGSILAKNARDSYIEELVAQYPILQERYGLLQNFGYGTKKHIAGIKAFGITRFHRKTFGICKESPDYECELH